MPFIGQPKCKKCSLYTKDYVQRYWVKCDKRCKIYCQKERKKQQCHTKKSYTIK